MTFDGDVAPQARITGEIHLARAPRADGSNNLLRAKPFARLERHAPPKIQDF